MRRRDFLFLATAVLPGCKLTMEQGMFNECRAPKGHALLRHPLVTGAWEGLRADRVWDSHAHLFGNGRSNTGLWMNPKYDDPTALAWRVRRAMFVNGGCAGGDEERMDYAAVDRLRVLMDEMPAGARLVLLAFDFTYDENGRKREELTAFSVSHAFAVRVARSNPQRFEWAGSIHPYRPDAIAALEQAKADGARAIKWLPPAMGIDLGEPRTLAFYDAMRRLDVPLIVHLGEEQAVQGAGRHDFANPLHIRHALDRGVRVVVAHCASLGVSPDLDANPNPAKAPEVANFELFRRLMNEKRYEQNLFGDLSAVTQANREGMVRLIMTERSWDGRLLNGTDYPLPGIMPLFSLNAFVSAGLLKEEEAVVLRGLRNVHPLMFDFVLKRSLRFQGQRLPDRAFETRDFFERANVRA
jgi:predicted TIM-barrel fold metal-dependent hydrolase